METKNAKISSTMLGIEDQEAVIEKMNKSDWPEKCHVCHDCEGRGWLEY